MKKLNVLFIDTDSNNHWNDLNFGYGCSTNNIEPKHIEIWEVPDFDFEDIDCIVYGFGLYSEEKYFKKLPRYIPRIVWTTSPYLFDQSHIDPIVERKFGRSVNNLPYYLQPVGTHVIDLLNKIKSVCTPVEGGKYKTFKDLYFKPHMNVPNSVSAYMQFKNGEWLSVIGGDKNSRINGNGKNSFEVLYSDLGNDYPIGWELPEEITKRMIELQSKNEIQ